MKVRKEILLQAYTFVLSLYALIILSSADTSSKATADGVDYFYFSFNDSIYTKSLYFPKINRTYSVNRTVIRCQNFTRTVTYTTSTTSTTTTTSTPEATSTTEPLSIENATEVTTNLTEQNTFNNRTTTIIISNNETTTLVSSELNTTTPTDVPHFDFENYTVCENVTEVEWYTDYNTSQGPSDWLPLIRSAIVASRHSFAANRTANITNISSIWAYAASECSARGMSLASVRTMSQWKAIANLVASVSYHVGVALYNDKGEQIHDDGIYNATSWKPSRIFSSAGRLPFNGELLNQSAVGRPIQRFVLSNNSLLVSLAEGLEESLTSQQTIASAGLVWLGGGSGATTEQEGSDIINNTFRWAFGRWAGSQWWEGPVNSSSQTHCLPYTEYSRQNQWSRRSSSMEMALADWGCPWAPNFPSNQLSAAPSTQLMYNGTRVGFASAMLNSTTSDNEKDIHSEDELILYDSAFLYDLGASNSLADLPWEVTFWPVEERSSNQSTVFKVTLRPLGGFMCMQE